MREGKYIFIREILDGINFIKTKKKRLYNFFSCPWKKNRFIKSSERFKKIIIFFFQNKLLKKLCKKNEKSK